MANEPDPLDLSPEQIARQLRHPEGEVGVQMGLHMNKGNRFICMNAYVELNPRPGASVLEIGMGNGYFVKELFTGSDILHYTGIDYSRTMIDAALEINKDLIEKGKVSFEHASIASIPFDDDTFDYVTTTNTIYFWPDPLENIKELGRVMKPEGTLVIGYRSRAFLNQVELAKHRFTKFAMDEVEHLLKTSGFKQVSTSVIKEPDTIKLDNKEIEMEGVFTKGTW